ncbi:MULTISPECIES: GntR family transcriptional regulator [Burkholderia]|jgi:DNA-binding GntR family transcriptional regulator|uniref:Bacterial regulatory s, gntR family protein n=1 Tax=Burkholderia gladioli TaxID=28095 RepID=A0AAP1UXT8_BURGA|nr:MULTISPECIES: GntR family transcriptional regulator [Burkholderia]AJX00915.1 bacterial regulatory s, gntR family protein [Burkholderia gladioli]ASD81053.1 GntR family transcriptional regulator [Burkholderia gladioli pv. gladioli]AWY53715.1 GntR family transcriptional regulator [Burkholderia gladioli pv. gladioli]KAF1063400.1 putative D-xylose utilization operon transcriptional repressor [Burkholderia gladioli]KGC17508.1 bacterial regulatory s, gntR family protein [Burkholderia gladioli]
MPAKLVKIQARTDYVDEVYRVLLDAISEGSIAPGTRIVQEEIAEQLAVSRSPVLQAFRLLKKDGLVEDAPGRGLQVAPLDAERIGHLYELRGALDSLAARLAARKQVKLDKSLIANGRKLSKGNDIKAMIEADMAFHSAIYAASGNPLIVDNARLHWMLLRRVMGAVHQVVGQRKTVWDEHAAIAEAIAAGDEELAARLSVQHTEFARENLVRHMSEAVA